MPSSTPILAPLTGLLLWTCVVWAWMYVTRIPAIKKAGMKLDPNLPKGQQMSELPPRVRWKADNYNHLLEQPTMFYAVTLTLALLGAGEGTGATGRSGISVPGGIPHIVQDLTNSLRAEFESGLERPEWGHQRSQGRRSLSNQ